VWSFLKQSAHLKKNGIAHFVYDCCKPLALKLLLDFYANSTGVLFFFG